MLIRPDANKVSRDGICRFVLFRCVGHSLCMTWSAFVITTIGNNDDDDDNITNTMVCTQNSYTIYIDGNQSSRVGQFFQRVFVSTYIWNGMTKECSYFSFIFYCSQSSYAPLFYLVYEIFLHIIFYIQTHTRAYFTLLPNIFFYFNTKPTTLFISRFVQTLQKCSFK